MCSLLRMPGPGGPTGRLEETVYACTSTAEQLAGAAGSEEMAFQEEDELEHVEANRCAEEVKVCTPSNCWLSILP